MLALAFAVRAAREGSSALHLDGIARLAPWLTGGDPDDDDAGRRQRRRPVPATSSTCRSRQPGSRLSQGSRLAAAGVLHVEFGLVQLDRYQQDERARRRLARPTFARWLEGGRLRRARAGDLRRGGLNDAQVTAVRAVAARPTTVLTGGPGTGKTWTVAELLRALRFADGRAPRVALAAPTGKAAAR